MMHAIYEICGGFAALDKKTTAMEDCKIARMLLRKCILSKIPQPIMVFDHKRSFGGDFSGVGASFVSLEQYVEWFGRRKSLID